MKRRYYIELICRICLGSILIYASYHKIMDPCSAASDIYRYRILPGYLVNICAIILPFVELVTGLALITGLYPRGASLGAIVLLTIFLAGISSNLISGRDISCGCFGSEKDFCESVANYLGAAWNITGVHLVRLRHSCDFIRDILFLIPAYIALILSNKRLGALQK